MHDLACPLRRHQIFPEKCIQLFVRSEQLDVPAPRDLPAGPVRRRGSATLAVTALVSAVALTGCGSSHRSAASPGAADTIVITNFAFSPSTLSVAPGAEVTVRNTDPATHTVTATGSRKPFDTGDIKVGATVTFTAPAKPGSYPYICQIHQFMHGTLTVR